MDKDILVGLVFLFSGIFCVWLGSTNKNKNSLYEKGAKIRLFIVGGLSILGGLLLIFNIIDLVNKRI